MFDMPAGVALTDDLDVALDANEYQDRQAPLPIYAGNYAARIKKSSLKEEFGTKGVIVLVKNAAGVPTYPVIRIEELEIVKPEELDGRRVFPGFQEFGTKPFERTDFTTNPPTKTPANNLSDMIRSVDSSLSYRGLEAGLSLFGRLVDEGALFHVQIDWLAEDRRWIGEQVKIVDAALQAGEITEEQAKTARNQARYKDGRQEGMKKFVVTGNGGTKTLSPLWTGPSGEDIEVKAVIKQFIPISQLDRYKLGPKKAF